MHYMAQSDSHSFNVGKQCKMANYNRLVARTVNLDY